MTDKIITARDFYTSIPLDALIRIRDCRIQSLELINDILRENGVEIEEKNDGFYLAGEEDEIFAGETVDEAIDTIVTAAE